MTDSSSFSSLFALVDSHLSKCNVQDSNSSDNERVDSLPIPMLGGVQRGLSDTRLSSPPQRLPIPSFSLSESPIAYVLSEQLSNMFKAKELKKKQEMEKEKLQEEMNKLKLEENNCVIDLMRAIQKPNEPQPQQREHLSSSSSLESLILDNLDFTVDMPTILDTLPLPPEPLLPCVTDMKYILNEKIKKAKASAFGKIVTSRVRPVAAPYLKDHIKSKVPRFDFKTPSPDDLIKEKLKRKPTQSCSFTAHDIF